MQTIIIYLILSKNFVLPVINTPLFVSKFIYLWLYNEIQGTQLLSICLLDTSYNK